jgi:hypothetical protein
MFTKLGIFKHYFLKKEKTKCGQKRKICSENNWLCIFSTFVDLRKEIFEKTKINFRKNFRKNAKTKIFVSILHMSHVCMKVWEGGVGVCVRAGVGVCVCVSLKTKCKYRRQSENLAPRATTTDL